MAADRIAESLSLKTPPPDSYKGWWGFLDSLFKRALLLLFYFPIVCGIVHDRCGDKHR